MNQILITKIVKKKEILRHFKIFFSISMIAITIIVFLYVSYNIQLEKEKTFSANVTNNYKIYKLFAEPNSKKHQYLDSDIYGTISIPKLDINYPFFYGINEELLKIYPCRFYGDISEKSGNLCIAGHNYNDNRFFSNIYKLENNDLIIIENNSHNLFYYLVYKKFDINEKEINSITKNTEFSNELTLLTCNNKNNKRTVIKAKTESL